MPETMAMEPKSIWKNKLVFANSCLFSTTEFRLSTILRECSAIIYALLRYQCLFHGSKHPNVLYKDHKTIFFIHAKEHTKSQSL